MKKTAWKKRAVAVLIAVLTIPSDAFAHVRTYAWNQIYSTLPKGQFEVEGYTTLRVPDDKHSNENEWEYQGELEYGVTDHLNIAHYERWETVNRAGMDDNGIPKKDSTKHSGFKFEAKYRIGEKGKYWVDPLLYLEISRDPRKHDIPMELEGKIVLSKDLGKFNLTYNQIMASELGSEGRTTHEFTLGMNYELFSGFRLGIESQGQYWNPGSNRNELAMGPTVAYETPWFWVAVGALFGLNHAADDTQARILVGVPF